MRGELAVKGRAQPVSLEARREDIAGDEIRLRAEGQLDRRELGVVGPAMIELMLGKAVHFTLDVRFRRATTRGATETSP